MDPQNSLTYQRLGEVLEASGDLSGAIDAFENSIEWDPNNSSTLNNAAWLYATADAPELRNPQKAPKYATRAVDLSMNRNAEILDTLAEAYYTNGDFDNATAVEKQAISIYADYGFFQEQLGKFVQAKVQQNF